MHDEYGYTKAFRDQVLRDADTYGVLTAAAKHKVGKSSIYRWKAEKERERIEQESWIDICARHLTMNNVLWAIAGFFGIIAVSHAITYFLSR
jgi:hypothetical protein